MVLLEYRNTPISTELGSPNQLMLGRNVNGILPNFNVTKEKNENGVNTYEKLKARQASQKRYHDKGARELENFEVGDQMRIRDNNKNSFEKQGIITSEAEKPRSYNVLSDNKTGRTINRNRFHLIRSGAGENFEIKDEQDLNENGWETSEIEQDDIVNTSDERREEMEDESVRKNIQKEPSVSSLATPKQTRSGRQVKRPYHLKDFV